jgi:thiamine-monophosphate kinase
LAAKSYNVDIIGGDTTSSQKGLILSITALGVAQEHELVYRSGAQENDLIVVTGDLGAAYLGLQVLEREKQVFQVNPNNQPDLDNYTYLIERQLEPEARTDIKGLLAQLEVQPTSMIDISDGLASEIFHIAKQSNVGVNLFEDKIPIDPMTYNTAREMELDPTLTALSGGEDYELLFTIKQADFDKIKNNPDITVIGHVTDVKEGVHMISKSGNVHPLKAQGWKAF